MPLKLTVAELTEVPEAMRGAYKQRTDGAGFMLDVEGGVVSKEVHDQFRQTNIQLKKKLEAFGELTPEQLTEIREANDTLKADLEKARKGKDSDAEARIKALTDGHTKALDGVTKERDTLKQRMDALVIDQEVSRVAAQVGAHATAIEDITGRIRARFKVGDDGKAYAVDPQGEKIYGEDGKPLGIDGAVRQLTKQAPHLFQASNGGGAANQSAGGGRSNTAGNPWKKDTWNVTEQMKLIKADKGEANRLAQEAGQSIA